MREFLKNILNVLNPVLKELSVIEIVMFLCRSLWYLIADCFKLVPDTPVLVDLAAAGVCF